MSSGGRTSQVTSLRIAWLNVNDEDTRAKLSKLKFLSVMIWFLQSRHSDMFPTIQFTLL